jgi:hypothetical protein
MSTALILGLVGGLLVLAFLANRLSGLTRIPDVLILMAPGRRAGAGLASCAALVAQPLRWRKLNSNAELRASGSMC